MNTVSLLPVKSYSPLPACSQWCQIDCHHQSQFHPSQESRIHCYQLAYSKFWSIAASQLIANPDSLLPAKPHPLWPECFQCVRIHCYPQDSATSTSKARSTVTSLLPAKPDFQRRGSEQVRGVRPNISACSKRLYQSYWSEPTRVLKVSMPELWEQLKLVRVMWVRVCACQGCPSKRDGVNSVHVNDA